MVQYLLLKTSLYSAGSTLSIASLRAVREDAAAAGRVREGLGRAGVPAHWRVLTTHRCQRLPPIPRATRWGPRGVGDHWHLGGGLYRQSLNSSSVKDSEFSTNSRLLNTDSGSSGSGIASAMALTSSGEEGFAFLPQER